MYLDAISPNPSIYCGTTQGLVTKRVAAARCRCVTSIQVEFKLSRHLVFVEPHRYACSCCVTPALCVLLLMISRRLKCDACTSAAAAVVAAAAATLRRWPLTRGIRHVETYDNSWGGVRLSCSTYTALRSSHSKVSRTHHDVIRPIILCGFNIQVARMLDFSA
jgi:hypothetical protein